MTTATKANRNYASSQITDEMGFVIQRTPIIGTTCVIFSVWEKGQITGTHSTITTINGEWYGRVGTERLPADLDALPAYSNERAAAVRAWQLRRYERAYDIIAHSEYGHEAMNGRYSMGQVEIYVD